MTLRVAMLASYPRAAFGLGEDIHPGGMRSAALNLLGGFTADPEVQVEVVITGRVGEALTVELGPNIRGHVVPVGKVSGMPVGYAPRIKAVRSYLRELDVDIVHGQGVEAEYGAEAVWSGLPNIVTVHGLLRTVKRSRRGRARVAHFVGRITERDVLRRARHIVAISSFVERQLHGLSRAQLHRIPNAIAPEFYQDAGDPEPDRVVYCGLISEAKGLRDAVLAVADLKDAGRPVRLSATGKVSSREYLDDVVALARSRLTAAEIELLGWLDTRDLTSLYGRAACLVIPSRVETGPMVMAEAMASGVPVVAYDVGWISDFVRDGWNGYVVPVGDHAGLARGIRAIVEDPEGARVMGANARATAEAFRPEIVAAATKSVYREVLSGGS